MIKNIKIKTYDQQTRKYALIALFGLIIIIPFTIIIINFKEKSVSDIIILSLTGLFLFLFWLLSLNIVIDKITIHNNFLRWRSLFKIKKVNIADIKGIDIIDREFHSIIQIHMKDKNTKYKTRVNSNDAVELFWDLKKSLIL